MTNPFALVFGITLACESGQRLPPGEYQLTHCAELRSDTILIAGFEL